MTPKWKMMLVMLIALTGIGLVLTGTMDRTLARMGLGKLARANHDYLERSYDSALEGFLVLSAIKSGLAVIEGSEVGIGFNLQVGDLVQSVYDYVNIAWKTVLVGGTILLMTRLALDGVAMLDHLVMMLAFCCLLLVAAAQVLFSARTGAVRLLRSLTGAFSVIAVLLYLVFPLAIFGAARLSEQLTRPLIQQSYDAFNQISQTFASETIENNLGSDGTAGTAMETVMGLNDRYERLKKRLQKLEEYLSARAKTLAGTTFQLIAGYLFDCVMFPFAAVVVVLILLRGVPAAFMRSQRDRRWLKTMRVSATGGFQDDRA